MIVINIIFTIYYYHYEEVITAMLQWGHLYEEK